MFGLSNNAFAEDTGNDMLINCRDTITYVETRNKALLPHSNACLKFIEGYLAGYNRALFNTIQTIYGDKLTEEKGQEAFRRMNVYCKPEHLTMGQIVRVYVKYLSNHPSKLHNRASLMLHYALKTAFPCHN